MSMQALASVRSDRIRCFSTFSGTPSSFPIRESTYGMLLREILAARSYHNIRSESCKAVLHSCSSIVVSSSGNPDRSAASLVGLLALETSHKVVLLLGKARRLCACLTNSLKRLGSSVHRSAAGAGTFSEGGGQGHVRGSRTCILNAHVTSGTSPRSCKGASASAPWSALRSAAPLRAMPMWLFTLTMCTRPVRSRSSSKTTWNSGDDNDDQHRGKPALRKGKGGPKTDKPIGGRATRTRASVAAAAAVEK
mmetsp:Transcript_30897/g.64041  ORF Transcript_30897/g.64041 Transcript_30897/m.64041 type:complete len:251 (-) Transcript_30897:59-811(-)